MQILVAIKQYSSPTVERWGGLFDVSFTEMLGFEQVPCYDGEHGFSNQEFLSFLSKYNIQNHDDAVVLIYEQYSGETESKTDSSSDDDLSGSDSEDSVASESEDDTSNSFMGFFRRKTAKKTVKKTEELGTLTRWFGVYVPTENALYLESPSTALHSDCLTDILDVAESINCFRVYIGIPRTRLDVVKRYLFAGFEISKKGQLQRPSAAIKHHEMKGPAAATQNHILLEYEL